MVLMAGGIKGERLVGEILDAFGLKHCRKLDIHFEHGSIFTITAECSMEDEQLKKIVPVIKKFQLVPIIELEEIDCIGDEIRTFQVIK